MRRILLFFAISISALLFTDKTKVQASSPEGKWSGSFSWSGGSGFSAGGFPEGGFGGGGGGSW